MIISVVIPMYNAEETVVHALDSVVTQTFEQPFEIIVVNDGSKDNSSAIVSDYIAANKSNRKIVLINKENGGVSSARNTGIMSASGEWIALLDSDDIWLPEKLEKQFQVISKNGSVNFIGTNRNGERYPYKEKSKKPLFSLKATDILLKCYPHPSTAVINRIVFQKVQPFDKKMTHGEDIDLWLRIADNFDLYVLNETLAITGGYKRSFGEVGLSANLEKMHEGELLALLGVFRRRKINRVQYLLYYYWMRLRYFRRRIIVRLKL